MVVEGKTELKKLKKVCESARAAGCGTPFFLAVALRIMMTQGTNTWVLGGIEVLTRRGSSYMFPT